MSAMAVDAPNVAAGNVIDARKTGRPGLPDYLPLENLAVAMAAQKAAIKPDQTASELNSGTGELYPAMLREVASVHCWPDGARWPKNNSAWTVEDSARERPLATQMWDRYVRDIRRTCKNDMSAELYKFYNSSDGNVPSGTRKEDAIQFVKSALWNAKMKPKVAITIDGDDDGPALSPDDAAGAGADSGRASGRASGRGRGRGRGRAGVNPELPKAMPDNWDGGPVFLTWVTLGPLGENHNDFKIPAASPLPDTLRAGSPASECSSASGGKRSTGAPPPPTRHNFLHIEHVHSKKMRKEDAISELVGLEQFHQLQTAWQQEFDILKFEYEVAFTDDEKREVRAKIAELSKRRPVPSKNQGVAASTSSSSTAPHPASENPQEVMQDACN